MWTVVYLLPCEVVAAIAHFLRELLELFSLVEVVFDGYFCEAWCVRWLCAQVDGGDDGAHVLTGALAEGVADFDEKFLDGSFLSVVLSQLFFEVIPDCFYGSYGVFDKDGGIFVGEGFVFASVVWSDVFGFNFYFDARVWFEEERGLGVEL